MNSKCSSSSRFNVKSILTVEKHYSLYFMVCLLFLKILIANIGTHIIFGYKHSKVILSYRHYDQENIVIALFWYFKQTWIYN